MLAECQNHLFMSEDIVKFFSMTIFRNKTSLIKRLNERFVLIVILASIVFNFVPTQIKSQSTTGFSGYFSIPSAVLSPDKSVNIGYNQLNKKYQEFYNGKYDMDVGFIDIGFLPIMEVGIRITRPRGFKNPDSKTTWDRMIAARVLPIKETKYFPGIAIGFQNFFTTGDNGGASHFNSTYIVATKNFEIKHWFKNLGITLGYGSDFMEASDYQFIGFFGGIEITPGKLEFLQLILEYDAENLNAGARLTLFKHLILLAGYEGLDAFSAGFSYRFYLP